MYVRHRASSENPQLHSSWSNFSVTATRPKRARTHGYKVSTFLADEALEGVLLVQKTYQLKYEARMDELGSELVVEDDEEEKVQDEQLQEGESDRGQGYAFSRLRVHYKKPGSCGKGVEEDMRQHPY